MRRQIMGVATAVGLVLAGAGADAWAAPPIDCKAAMTGRSRSDAAGGPKERQRIATEGAIAHWRKLVREAYGWRYRYWAAARAKSVRCSPGAGSLSCAVTARPCRSDA